LLSPPPPLSHSSILSAQAGVDGRSRGGVAVLEGGPNRIGGRGGMIPNPSQTSGLDWRGSSARGRNPHPNPLVSGPHVTLDARLGPRAPRYTATARPGTALYEEERSGIALRRRLWNQQYRRRNKQKTFFSWCCCRWGAISAVVGMSLLLLVLLPLSPAVVLLCGGGDAPSSPVSPLLWWCPLYFAYGPSHYD
jgi:hypothetical protein